MLSDGRKSARATARPSRFDRTVSSAERSAGRSGSALESVKDAVCGARAATAFASSLVVRARGRSRRTLSRRLRSSSASRSIVLRLNRERLEVGALDASAEDVVASGLAGALELLQLLEPSRGEGDAAALNLGEPAGEQRVQVSPLHIDIEPSARLLFIEAAAAANVARGSGGRDDASALKKSLRQRGCDGVGVGLIEDRVDRGTASVLVDVRVARIHPKLGETARSRERHLRLRRIDERGAELHLVRASLGSGDGVLDGQTQCIRIGRRG